MQDATATYGKAVQLSGGTGRTPQIEATLYLDGERMGDIHVPRFSLGIRQPDVMPWDSPRMVEKARRLIRRKAARRNLRVVLDVERLSDEYEVREWFYDVM